MANNGKVNKLKILILMEVDLQRVKKVFIIDRIENY